jgi:GT2 family glycosyltransferase
MLSVIVCSADPAKAAASAAHYHRLLGAEPHEVIGIPDARSLAEGYNRGVARSRGELLVFSHDDVEVLTPDLVPRLVSHLAAHDVVGMAGTTRLIDGNWVSAGPPHIFGQVAHPAPSGKGYVVCLYGAPTLRAEPVQALDGLFLACRREVFASLCFDEQTFDGFHCYDSDFTFAAYLAGFRLAVCNDIALLHASGGTYDKKWEYAMRLFANKYRDRLPPAQRRPFQFATVQVQTRQEVLEVMGLSAPTTGSRQRRG